MPIGSSDPTAMRWDLRPPAVGYFMPGEDKTLIEYDFNQFAATVVHRKSDKEWFLAGQIAEDSEERADVARWVGAAIYDAGLRVPTLDGVEAAFVGDWVVRDQQGRVFVYTDENFHNEFDL